MRVQNLSNTRRRAGFAPLALSLLFFAAAGCGGGSGGGTVVIGPGSVPVLLESEPNDFAPDANFFGSVLPGDHFIVEGSVFDPLFDPFDGFAFVADVPCTVEFFLHADDPFADFDLCVYDPAIDDFVACWETAANPESGFISIVDPGVEFHLVVSPFSGLGFYALEVFVSELDGVAAFSASADGEPESSIQASSDPGPGRPELKAERRAYFAPEPLSSARPGEEEPEIAGTLVEFDPSDGQVRQRTLIRLPDGSVVATD